MAKTDIIKIRKMTAKTEPMSKESLVASFILPKEGRLNCVFFSRIIVSYTSKKKCGLAAWGGILRYETKGEDEPTHMLVAFKDVFIIPKI